MGKDTSISWTDHTFNPWWGCLKVSPGCQHCYAEHLAVVRRHMPIWGPASIAKRSLMSKKYWMEPLKWNRKAQIEEKRQRVFCASMADVFEDHPDVVAARADLWDLIESTPALDWLLLTKRPENAERMMPDRWLMGTGIPRNVWLGTSAEDQEAFDKRWPALETFAHHYHPEVVFLSLEPLLGPINLTEALIEINLGDEDRNWWTRTVDWVIVGGESGVERRFMSPEWARGLRDQCIDAQVPFFFKQTGGLRGGSDLLDGQKYHNWPGQTTVAVRPKAPPAAGEYQMELFS